MQGNIYTIFYRWLESPVAMTYPVTIETSTFSDGIEIDKETFHYLVSEHYAGKLSKSFLVLIYSLSVTSKWLYLV